MCTLYFHGHSQAYLFVNAMKWNFMYECLQFHFHFNISKCIDVLPNYDMVTVGGL